MTESVITDTFYIMKSDWAYDVLIKVLDNKRNTGQYQHDNDQSFNDRFIQMSAALHAKKQRQHHKWNHTYCLTKNLPVQNANARIDDQSECAFDPEYKAEIAFECMAVFSHTIHIRRQQCTDTIKSAA